jgi:hypothetical protein
MRERVRCLVLMLWAGGLAFSGAVAAPVTFAVLPMAEAGTATGAMFRAAGWLSLPASMAFILLLPASERQGLRLWLSVSIVVLLVLAVFVLGGVMDQIRATQGPGSVPRWLHGLASLGYVGACVLAVALVWREAGAGCDRERVS